MSRPRLTATQARHLAAGVLGIDPRAEFDQARQAYRRLVADHHPDAPNGDHETFVTIQTAWEVWLELSGAHLAAAMTPVRSHADGFARGMVVDVVA